LTRHPAFNPGLEGKDTSVRYLPSARWLLLALAWWCFRGEALRAGQEPSPAGAQQLPALSPAQIVIPPGPEPAPAVDGVCPGVVFVANGGGDLRGATEGFKEAVKCCDLPWYVQTVCWSICPGPGLADLVNSTRYKVSGQMLASTVIAWRANHPHDTICLAGHSAGAAVVLAAAECLPPGSVDHIVLLEPSLSAYCDLTPALVCARCAVDLYYSPKDCFLLSIWIFGNCDHCWTKIMGVSGSLLACHDEALCSKLRQHPWEPEVKWTGHNGGHFGCLKPEHLRAYVLPLLLD
jgi:hypothetical protein